MQVSMQGNQLCVSLSLDNRVEPSYIEQENTFPGPDSDGLPYSLQMSPDSRESNSGRLLIWKEQSTRYHQSKTVERHSYQEGGIMVWAGISLGGHTDLHVFQRGTVTGVRYRDEILDPYIHPYTGAIGNDSILMDDNARPQQAAVVEEYLEGLGLERIEWPALSSNLNPVDHLWNHLGRQVAALSPPPRSSRKLEQNLLRVWFLLPISVTDNLIAGMESRCRQCIQARGGHIPY